MTKEKSFVTMTRGPRAGNRRRARWIDREKRQVEHFTQKLHSLISDSLAPEHSSQQYKIDTQRNSKIAALSISNMPSAVMLSVLVTIFWQLPMRVEWS
jgi:hypothetical protein